eukprot:TRINITY_DN1511_c0_g1_i2.p1 TRINITY_DN1511_c0_g1~~TRINITY_DN1511_c0_g1_i2.p1  ORF type:complete len:579 (-),score=89.58 TRINITY_DN1511_c0_g1_i2:743-2440(-)
MGTTSFLVLFFVLSSILCSAEIRVSSTTAHTVSLEWDLPSGTSAADVAGYHIYRLSKQVGTTVQSRFTDTNLTPNSSYQYNITWFNKKSGKEEVLSDVISTRTRNSGVGRVLLEWSPLNAEKYKNINGREYLTSPSFSTLLSYRHYRLRAYINPTVTGTYSFLITFSLYEFCELYLSENDQPSGILIANTTKPQSSPINLRAYQKYYLELFVVGGVREVEVGIQWQADKQPMVPIPIEYLSPYDRFNGRSVNITEAFEYATLTHPRLIASEYRFAWLRTQVKVDPTVAALFQSIKSSADKILTQSPVVYEPGPTRALDLARLVVTRSQTLGLVYNVIGNLTYARRAWAEIEAVATKWPDWKFEEIFLTVAEMSYGVAVGLDWIYNTLTESQKTLAFNALFSKSFNNAIGVYTGTLYPPKDAVGPFPYWPKAYTNWNFVCNGALILASLATYNETSNNKQLEFILEHAINGIKIALETFAPDGIWYESPGYWGYSYFYMVKAFAGMESSLGTDFNLPLAPGLATSMFSMMSTSGVFSWTYGDSDYDATPSIPELLWLSQRYSHVQS